MSFSRLCRRSLAGLLMASLLFAQLATAATACSLIERALQGAATAELPADDPDALCQQHCQFGKTQLPAAPDLPPLPTALPPVLRYALPAMQPAGAEPARWVGHARTRERAPPPIHSILHCCLRT